MGSYWDSIIALQSGREPATGTYSVDYGGLRFPSMVAGNTEWLAPAIKAGYSPRITEDQMMRALAYAMTTHNYKSSSEPMSPLGSGYDFFNPSSVALSDLRKLLFNLGSPKTLDNKETQWQSK